MQSKAADKHTCYHENQYKQQRLVLHLAFDCVESVRIACIHIANSLAPDVPFIRHYEVDSQDVVDSEHRDYPNQII